MAIPTYQAAMLPALKAISLKEVTTSKEIVERVIKEFKLTPTEIETLLPSKTQRVIDNRVHWALSYMYKAGLVSKPTRGKFTITQEGKKILQENLKELSTNYLLKFESFRNFKNFKRNDNDEPLKTNTVEQSDPQEELNRKTQEQSPVKHNVFYRQAGIRAQFRGGETFKLG
jgi:restriction system protein